MDSDYEIKPLSIMLIKASTYVKVIKLKRNRCIFWLNHISENSATIVWKKNLIASQCTIKKFLKAKIKSYNPETTEFYSKEMPRVTLIIFV